jgi:hypothetical protein
LNGLTAALRGLAVRCIQAITLAAEYPLAVLGSCAAACIPLIRRIEQGLDPNAGSRRYAIYASYDRHSLVADYVVAQIEALARIGYRVIVVWASPFLREAQLSKLAPHSWKIVHRRNLGHDFGCYKTGVQQIGQLREIESLILMNDSCYGPLFDLAEVEQKAHEAGTDLWGITDCWWKSYHLQSYYLRLNDRAVSSEAFRRFWTTLLPFQSRNLVVRHGEVRLTQHLMRAGLTTAVLCPYRAVAEKALELILSRTSDDEAGLLPSEKRYLEALAEEISRGSRLNPMHPFWDVLIVEFACPFVKRNLLRSNPARIRGLVDWPSLLAAYTGYDVDLIDRHLKIK